MYAKISKKNNPWKKHHLSHFTLSNWQDLGDSLINAYFFSWLNHHNGKNTKINKYFEVIDVVYDI